MDKYTATELAFKNGYEKGYKAATDNNVGCKWIPVGERLPGIDQNVLMYFQEANTFVCGFLTKENGRDPLWCSFTDAAWYTECDDRPDYWMPLPEPPKEV